MIFHVIDKESGRVLAADGFWCIDEDGELWDVIDGWNCEGGGGPAAAPTNAIVVMGPAPKQEAPIVVTAPSRLFKSVQCGACGKKFFEVEHMNQHFDKVHM